MMSRRIIIAASVAMLSLAIAAHALLAARIKPAVSKTSITADSGFMKKTGDKLSVTLNNNVTLTNKRDGLTSILKCKRLQADDISSESMDAEASGAPKISYEIELQENGAAVKYRIDISGELIGFEKKQLLIVQSGKNERALFIMTPLDKAGKRKAKLAADRIEYHLDIANSHDTSNPFVIASGNVAMSAVAQAKQPVKETFYRVNATAERVFGQFEKVTEGQQISQVFRLDGGKGVRPHIELVNLDEKTPDTARLDADAMAFYPLLLSSPATASSEQPLLLARATGDVKIFSATKQGADKVTLQGDAGELLYRFYQTDNKDGSYERVICLKRGENGVGTPAGTYQDGADSKPIPFRAPFMFFNLDQQLFSLAKTMQQGEANIGVRGGRQ